MTPALPERRNLREEIVEVLRASVITGKLLPGTVYSAPVMAAEFGVSPTPVREAMVDLASEGLVETVRNKGFRVVELSERDLDELTALRGLIEIPTVHGVVAQGASSRVVKKLRSLAAAIEKAAVDGDLVAHVVNDTEFHLCLLALSGNRQLVDTVRTLRGRARIYGLRTLFEHGELATSASEHSELVDLLQARDAESAVKLMGRHIGHVRTIWAATDRA